MIYQQHGKTSEKSFEDYFTIIQVNGEYKLNINSYIGKEEINKEKILNDITIKIISKQIYIDHETYKITITNHTQKTIFLDGFRKLDSIYLLTEADTKIGANRYELIPELLVLRSGAIIETEITFNQIYETQVGLSKIVFSDIILDEEEYNKDKENYQNVLSIEMDI